MRFDINITDNVLDISALMALIDSPENGAVAVFAGTVRNATNQRSVQYLEYEAYMPMALECMQEVCRQACTIWQSITGIVLHHRIGRVDVGGTAVVAVITAQHRAEVFVALSWLIDAMKTHVPIWKKEVYADGSLWVSAHA